MQWTPIQVETRAGDEADEMPARLQVQGQWVEVGEILDRWYQGEGDPEWPPAHYFKVIGYNFLEYLLKRD